MLKKKEEVQNQEKESKTGIKDKVKRFLKNKKAVAMLMEYIITIECFAMLFLLIAPEEVKATTSTANENGITWAYTLDENGNATNVYYKSGTLGKTVTIPASLDGYPVVSLYNSSNSNSCIIKSTGVGNTTVSNVIIPSSVKTIGDYAFYRCSGLTSVTIPSSVTTIGNYAFDGCSGLTRVTIPSSVTTIENYAFNGCSGLTSVTIPSSVTTIENYAFKGCSGLTSVTIPSSVTTIGNYAFNGCRGLTSVTIPSSVTTIGDYAFNGCSGLTSVTIPNSVTSIGNSAFAACSNLTNLAVDGSNPNYSSENDILYNKDRTELIYCVTGKQGTVTIPSGVTSIEQYAFAACSSLTSVEIPTSVTIIGEFSFSSCSSLANLNIPSSVTAIGQRAFQYCTSLASVEIPTSVTIIETSVFQNCSSLTNVVIPTSVTTIGVQAFMNCSNLTSVTVPSSVESIEQYAFHNCSNLKNVKIQEGVMNIGHRAFYMCSNLISISIPNTVTRIKNGAFNGCSKLTSVTIPSSVEIIEDAVFYNCSKLKTVKIQEGVINIGVSAFYGCASLITVEIPNSVTNIGNYVFKNCSNLTDIYVQNLESNITLGVEWSGNAEVHYMQNTYEVTFDSNGGSRVENKTVTYDSTYGALETPTKEGHTFAGWYQDEGLTQEVTSETIVTTPNNHMLYAKWTINQYEVTFIAEGVTVGTITKNYGETITVAEFPEVPEKTGYTGVWNQREDIVLGAENKEITASYTVNTYEVTFNSNGGSRVENKTVTYDSTYGALETPTKEGHTFAGWYQDEGLTQEVTSETIVTTPSNHTIYAKWKQQTVEVSNTETKETAQEETEQIYTIKYVDEENKVIEEIKSIDGENAGVMEAPEKEGYEFIGWEKEINEETKEIIMKPIYKEMISGQKESSLSIGEKVIGILGISVIVLILIVCFKKRKK